MSGGGYRHLKNASPAKVQRAMLVFQVPSASKTLSTRNTINPSLATLENEVETCWFFTGNQQQNSSGKSGSRVSEIRSASALLQLMEFGFPKMKKIHFDQSIFPA
jgi:hypothetical protein